MIAAFQGKELVAGMVDIVGQAITHGRLEDAEAVIAAVRVLRPRLAELETFEAWIAIRRGRWTEAMRILRNVELAAPNFVLAKALLALCQFTTGDATWRASAYEVIDQGSSAEATGLVRLLLDPESAGRDAPPEPSSGPSDKSGGCPPGPYLRA